MKERLTSSGKLDLESTMRDRPMESALQEAVRLFVELVTAAPATVAKCKCCRRYFINPTGRKDRRYCKRKCALYATAVECTKRRWQREREEKLRDAQGKVGSWNGSGHWKAWVAEETGLSLTFLTRAVRRGELREP